MFLALPSGKLCELPRDSKIRLHVGARPLHSAWTEKVEEVLCTPGTNWFGDRTGLGGLFVAGFCWSRFRLNSLPHIEESLERVSLPSNHSFHPALVGTSYCKHSSCSFDEGVGKTKRIAEPNLRSLSNSQPCKPLPSDFAFVSLEPLWPECNT